MSAAETCRPVYIIDSAHADPESQKRTRNSETLAAGSAVSPRRFTDPEAIAAAIIERAGNNIVVATPLGLGKPNHILNALIDHAIRDSSINLRIFTALTLERPEPKGEIEKRFFEPAMDRLFGKYPRLRYAELLRAGELPGNIEVDEFFFLAGRWVRNERAQRNYISANYTDALEYILDRGVNVVAQLGVQGAGDKFSLSCNPDITVDLLNARKQNKADFCLAAQTNSALPFMEGDAAIPGSEIDYLLDSSETDFELYSAPKRPVSLADAAIGLHVARLVADGGTLQIGIGSIGDAVAHALILRHQQNKEFKSLVQATTAGGRTPRPCEDAPFTEGLYGCSEMFVDGFLQLEKAGVLSREVDNAVLHAAFFVDSRDFYKTLREMPDEKRRRFAMKPVSFTNSLYGGVDARREARVKARFVNNAMMATLLGAVVSDATEDGQVVSGVGGQFDFVEQAFALDGARSIITFNATRDSKGETVSNIVWSYGHATIPRHRRDIIVTEYGVADLRGKSDEDVIAAMLSVTDSHFQPQLLAQAKAAGKIGGDYEIPAAFCDNRPERLQKALGGARRSGLLPAFPFGGDFTEVEQRLLPALNLLKRRSAKKTSLAKLAISGAMAGKPSPAINSALERLRLDRPTTLMDRVYRLIVHGALLRSGDRDER